MCDSTICFFTGSKVIIFWIFGVHAGFHCTGTLNPIPMTHFKVDIIIVEARKIRLYVASPEWNTVQDSYTAVAG